MAGFWWIAESLMLITDTKLCYLGLQGKPGCTCDKGHLKHQNTERLTFSSPFREVTRSSSGQDWIQKLKNIENNSIIEIILEIIP